MTYVVFCIDHGYYLSGAFASKNTYTRKNVMCGNKNEKNCMIVSKRHPLRNTSRGSEDGEGAKRRQACTNISF